MNNLELSKNQIEILDHTLNRATGKRYCGECPDVRRLVIMGLMRELGKVSWVPDPYFTITDEGIKALQEAK